MQAKKEERLVKIVKDLSKIPSNKRCADCTEKLPQYVNLTFHTFICTACSGIHREFSHRVKSISLSTFTIDEVKALKEGGNENCAKVYLARWDPRDHAEPEAGQEQRIRDWIRAKYIEKRWHMDSSYIPGVTSSSSRSRAGSGSKTPTGSYDPHPPTHTHTHTHTLGPRRQSSGAGSSRSLGIPPSQPISAVLPDVKGLDVQKGHTHTHTHTQPPAPKNVNLLDLAFGPGSPERPARQQDTHTQQPQQFAADPFASNSGWGAGMSGSVTAAAGPGATTNINTNTYPQPPLPPHLQQQAYPSADPFASNPQQQQYQQPPPQYGAFPSPPPPPSAPTQQQGGGGGGGGGFPGYPPIPPPGQAPPSYTHTQPPQPQPQPPQAGGAPSYTGGWPSPPPPQPGQAHTHTYAQPLAQGASPPPPPPYGSGGGSYALPFTAIRPVSTHTHTHRQPKTLSIEDAFGNLGIDTSTGGMSTSASGNGGVGVGVNTQASINALPVFVAGEEVIYTDSQGKRCKTVVKQVHVDDHPPYYTIKLANGAERQTDFHHIAKILTPAEKQAQAQQQAAWRSQQQQQGGGVGVGVGASPPPPPLGSGGGGGGAPWDLSSSASLKQQQQQPQQGPVPAFGQQANPFLAASSSAAAVPPQQQAAAPASGNPFDMF